MVDALTVIPFRDENNMVGGGLIVAHIEICRRSSACKRTCSRTQTQRRSNIFGIQYFFSQYIAIGIKQLAGKNFRKSEIQLFACVCERVEVINRILRRQNQFGLNRPMMNGLGTNDNIAIARAIGTDMQTRCTLFPTTVVLFYLHRTKSSERNTYRIDNIDILAIINDINRGIQTAGDGTSEIVLFQAVVGYVRFIYIQNSLS